MAAARKRTKQKNTRLRDWWASYWPAIQSRIFAPEPETLPPFPTQAEFLRKQQANRRSSTKAVLRDYERKREEYDRQVARRRAIHDETSKTIRRVFYTLIATCLFCVITLAGAPDAQLLTPEATIKLPVLNYDISFAAFLIVGPVILIALTIYLHIFVARWRRFQIAEEDQQQILPNFSGWTPSMAVLFIFYWMVPITLAVFAWKAWPRPNGSILGYVAFGVAAVLVLLQMRRCPRTWRAWAFPFLVIAFALFVGGLGWVTVNRQLDLFKADLSEKDLRNTNLSRAFLSEAILVEANLSGAILIEANLSKANLSKANLSKAILVGADLSKASLSEANLSKAYVVLANLIEADLSKANLSEANLSLAILIEANLSGADLSKADLSKADLIRADLSKANLSLAHLIRADLSKADLSKANLSEAKPRGANLSEAKLRGANLSRASLFGADLSEADLSEADLSEANLSRANLSKADLSEADLSRADLSLANLSEAKVDQLQLDRACGVAPPTLTPPLVWKPGPGPCE